MAAQFGPCSNPFILTDLELVGPIPQGGLTTPQETDDAEGITAILASRFPTPPSAFGFLIDVDFGLEVDGVTQSITSALTPPGNYLEPTTGQIWPRVG